MAHNESFTQNVRELQDLKRESVEAIGARLAPQFRREVGRLLGGLQSIGALRSGAVTAGIGRASERFGEQVGIAAREATGDVFGTALGLEELAFRRSEAEKARRSSFLGGVGRFVSRGVAGFIAGGPAGAAATIATGFLPSGGGDDDATQTAGHQQPFTADDKKAGKKSPSIKRQGEKKKGAFQ